LLDLATYSWSKPWVGGACPPPTSGHVATPVGDTAFAIFGGWALILGVLVHMGKIETFGAHGEELVAVEGMKKGGQALPLMGSTSRQVLPLAKRNAILELAARVLLRPLGVEPPADGWCEPQRLLGTRGRARRQHPLRLRRFSPCPQKDGATPAARSVPTWRFSALCKVKDVCDARAARVLAPAGVSA